VTEDEQTHAAHNLNVTNANGTNTCIILFWISASSRYLPSKWSRSVQPNSGKDTMWRRCEGSHERR